MTDPAPFTSPTTPVRVLLVDPDECVRESLEGLLRIGDRLRIVGSAGAVDAALDLAAAQAPDVVVIDPRLPEADGAATTFIARLRDVVPGVRVLVLSWSGAPEGLTAADGADAYIRKTFRPHELIDAVLTTGRRSVA